MGGGTRYLRGICPSLVPTASPPKTAQSSVPSDLCNPVTRPLQDHFTNTGKSAISTNREHTRFTPLLLSPAAASSRCFAFRSSHQPPTLRVCRSRAPTADSSTWRRYAPPHTRGALEVAEFTSCREEAIERKASRGSRREEAVERRQAELGCSPDVIRCPRWRAQPTPKMSSAGKTPPAPIPPSWSMPARGNCSWGPLSDLLDCRRKLVIIGDGACGKTSLLSVFTLGYFPTVSLLLPTPASARPFTDRKLEQHYVS